jgi:hypothetical protein
MVMNCWWGLACCCWWWCDEDDEDDPPPPAETHKNHSPAVKFVDRRDGRQETCYQDSGRHGNRTQQASNKRAITLLLRGLWTVGWGCMFKRR